MPPRPEAQGGAIPGAIPGLDGLRALAVMLVFFAHNGLENLVPGGLGVTLFFVLSGYLITTLMRIEQARTGGIRFRAFYLRRALRLMPPLFLVIAAAGVISTLDLVRGDFSREGLASVLFYLGNYYVIGHEFHGLPGGVGVVWSLAVEEHFYLLYPPLALWLLRRARPASSAALLALACAAVLGRRIWLALHGVGDDYIGMATDTRIDSILVGCLMGLAANPWLAPAPAPAPARRGRELLGAGICIAVLLASLLIRDDFFRLSTRYSVQSLAIAPLIWLAVARSREWPFRWLNARPLVYLGQISYTVYLAHQMIYFCVAKRWPEWSWLATTGATAVLTLAAAAIMRRFVELPCARLRSRLHREPAPVLSELATESPVAAA